MQDEICRTAIRATIENTSTLLVLLGLGTMNAALLVINTWLTRRIERQRRKLDKPI